jgi:hypothetical protein
MNSCLISNPKVSEADIEEWGKDDSAQDPQHPEPGLVFEGSGRVQQERGHDYHQGQRVVIGLKVIAYFLQKIT